MKILMPVLVVTLFFGLATTAKADMQCGVSSTPIFRGTATGLTEPIGEVTFTCIGTQDMSPTTEATLILEFGVPITNSLAYPAAAPIRITNDTNQFLGGVAIVNVENADGVITLTLPAVAAPDPNVASEFTVSGILANLFGAGAGQIDAVVSASPGDGYTIGAQQDEATVLRNVADGIRSVEITNTEEVLTDGSTTDDGLIAVEITENYIDMFRNDLQFSEDGQTEATNSTEIMLTFLGLPEDIDFTACAATMGDAAPGDPSVTPGTITSTANTALISFGSATEVDNASIDSVILTCDVTADSAPRGGEVTVSATLHPIGTAFDGSEIWDVLPGGEIPRYAEELLMADGSVLDFGDVTTTLLIPFAMSLGDIDTGISVANTSNDPESISRVDASTGPVTFWFFNQDADGDGDVGDPVVYTTASDSPGVGLDPDGLVPAGSSYLVNLSELLQAADTPGDFAGYIFIQTGFTHAHGGAFVVDWGPSTNFTSATDVLVLEGENLNN